MGATVDNASPNAAISLEANGSTYYRWGIAINGADINPQYVLGSGYYTAKTLIPGFELNTWYVLVLKVDHDAGSTGEWFRMEVYKKSNPGIRVL